MIPELEVTDADLSNLGLLDDGDFAVDLDNLPQERSSVPRELPTPGATLVLTLPTITKENWQSIIKPLPTDSGQRIQVVFQDENSLRLSNGSPFSHTFTSRDQAIYDKGVVTGQTNDIARLLKALGVKGALNSKADYVRGFLASSGGTFKVENVPQPYCNPKKPIFKDGKKQENTLGCGRKYALKADSYTKKDGTKVEILQIPRADDGTFKAKFECQCGGFLTAWPRFENYKKA